MRTPANCTETETLSATPAPVVSPTPSSPNQGPGTKGLRVFTAGHSFHVWVAPILDEIAKSAGLSDHQIVGVLSIGASQVIDHWLAGADDGGSKLKSALTAGEIDVLTVSPIYLPDEGIRQFASYGVKYNPNFRLAVLSLWVPNDEFVPHFPYKRRDYSQNDTAMSALHAAQDAYDRVLNDYVALVNSKLHREVIQTVPAGQAVVALREKVIAGQAPGVTTQKDLFADTWGHPHEVIKALEGYCEFAVIYRRSPVGLPVPQILRESKIPVENLAPLNRLLQQLAQDAVIHDPMSGVTNSLSRNP
ncbi:hypothetical protein BH09VER1_BH09VER1_19580 [soil metagenome]